MVEFEQDKIPTSCKLWIEISSSTSYRFCVFWERLFSETGNLYEQKCNWLLPKTGKKLLFYQNSLKKVICSKT